MRDAIAGVTVRGSALNEKGPPRCSAADRVRLADRFSSRIHHSFSASGVADAGSVPVAVSGPIAIPVTTAVTSAAGAGAAGTAGSSAVSE